MPRFLKMLNDMAKQMKNLPLIKLDIDKQFKNKQDIFKYLSITLEPILNISKSIIYNSIITRERIADTSFENKIALPHIILQDLKHSYIAIIRLTQPISNWICIDKSKVQILICLIIPRNSNVDKSGTKQIIKIFRKLGHESVTNRISKSNKVEEICQILLSQI